MDYGYILIRNFKKYRTSLGITKIFEDLSSSENIIVLNIIKRYSMLGNPVIFAFNNLSNWIIITDQEIFLSREGDIVLIPLKNIIDATVDYDIMKSSGSKLNQWQQLLVRTNSESIKIFLEAGESFFGIWNALKSIAAINNRSSKMQSRQ